MSIADDVTEVTELVVKHGWDNIARDSVIVMLCSMMRDVLGKSFEAEVKMRLDAYSKIDFDNPEAGAAIVGQMRYLVTGEREG